MLTLLQKKKPVTSAQKGADFAFRDLDNIAYYRVQELFNNSLERHGKKLEYLEWMSAGISGQELDALAEAGEQALEKYIQKDKSALTTIGWVLRELRMRKNMIIHTELLYNFAALHYIREDEDKDQFNQQIQDEKVEAFKKLVAVKGAYDFFQLPELKLINEMLSGSRKEWEQFWNASIREQTLLKRKLEYLKSANVSAEGKRTAASS